MQFFTYLLIYLLAYLPYLTCPYLTYLPTYSKPVPVEPLKVGLVRISRLVIVH